MKIRNLRIYPDRHIFKTIGAATGLIGIGVFGLIFGFIGGALIDQLSYGFIQKRHLRNFFKNPGKLSASGATPALTSAAGAACAWFFCRNDSTRSALTSDAIPEFFPDSPRLCAEVLTENADIDYTAAAVFFGRNADIRKTEAFNSLMKACGLDIVAVRSVLEDPEGEAARILASAGFQAGPANHDYELLGLTPGAEAGEIKRVYHKLASQFHPDAGNGLSAEQQKISEEAFKLIHAAYERLIRN